MTTSEKLTRLKTDFDDVYNKGYEDGKAEGGNTAKGEQEKTVNITENGTTEVLPDENKVLSKVIVNVDVPSGGGVDYMPYVKTLAFSSAISEITDDIYIDLSNANSLANTFFGLLINCNKITVKISSVCTNLSGSFRVLSSSILKEVEIIGDTSNVSDYSRAFYDARQLESVIGELDFTNTTSLLNMVTNCASLKKFTPKAETIKLSISFSSCANLTDETIQAIFDGLATVETTQTLTLHNQVKILQSQVDSANAKGWTVAGGTVVSEEEYYG